MDASPDRRTAAPTAPDQDAPERLLTICGIGYAQSPHVRTRLQCFAERGHKVYIITETAASPDIPGVTQLVPALDASVTSSRWFKGIFWFCRKFLNLDFDHVWRPFVFVRMLRRCRPDIVHVHYAYAYYSWLAGLLGARPLVVTVMGGDVLFEEQGAPTPTGIWLTLNVFRRADYITSKAHHLTAVLDRLGGFGKKAERIVWGIPVRRFGRVDASPLRKRFGVKPDERVIVSPKILQRLYRVHLIVEAMPKVLAECPDAMLLIMEYGADPEYRAEIAARIADLGLDNKVRFIGKAAHSEMPMFYSLADVLVSVPSSDGLPQSLLESMACTAPNIMSKLPRYQEIVEHEVSAYFVDDAPAAIAAGIVELLRNPELRRKIAANALAVVKREGDLDEQARRVEKRYIALADTIRPRSFDLRYMLSSWWRFRAHSARA
jgi:glycosyltransferase involved in cell wall biosynthesis